MTSTRSGTDERGMVTAEAALVIPVLLAVTLTLSWAIAVGAAQVKLIDAAREGARLAARGEPASVVEAAIGRAGPEGTTGTVSTSGGTVSVSVKADVSPELPLLGDVGDISLGAQATAAAEETGVP